MRLLLILAALPLFASDFCVSARPGSTKATAGTWEVIITRATGHVSREDIAERLPLSMLFEQEARDELDHKTATSIWTIVKEYGGVMDDLAPAGITVAALRIGNPWAQAGGAIAGLVYGVARKRTAARQPNPANIKAKLLPDSGVPGNWDGRVVTGSMPVVMPLGPFCGPRQEVGSWADDKLVYAMLNSEGR